jgi:hypothetical protein
VSQFSIRFLSFLTSLPFLENRRLECSVSSSLRECYPLFFIRGDDVTVVILTMKRNGGHGFAFIREGER